MNDSGVVFNIILGTACNWHCEYCIQDKGGIANRKHDPKEFADKLLAFINQKGIKEIKRFSYWGGEPLLYQRQIEALLEKFSGLKTKKPHRTITNGSLMNDEFVAMANKYHMLINVSYHDGQLAKEQWEKCLHIENLNVTSLIHHERLNFDEFYGKWQWIREEFGRCVNWFVYPMLSVDGVGSKYALTKDDVDVYVTTFFIARRFQCCSSRSRWEIQVATTRISVTTPRIMRLIYREIDTCVTTTAATRRLLEMYLARRFRYCRNRRITSYPGH